METPQAPSEPMEVDEALGGESACYAHLLCPSCGAVLDQYHEACAGSDLNGD